MATQRANSQVIIIVTVAHAGREVLLLLNNLTRPKIDRQTTISDAIRPVQSIGPQDVIGSNIHTNLGKRLAATEAPPKMTSPTTNIAKRIAKNAMKKGSISNKRKHTSNAFRQPAAPFLVVSTTFLFPSESETTCSLIFSGLISLPCILNLSSGVLASGTTIQMKR